MKGFMLLALLSTPASAYQTWTRGQTWMNRCTLQACAHRHHMAMCANDAEQLPLVVGRLQFGATRGPRTWHTDRDGPWVPAYWVEIQGGLDDGEVVLIPDKARIARGLSAGDLCAIEYDVEGARCIALEENEYATAEAAVKTGFRFETPSTRGFADRLLRSAAKPIGITLAIVAAGAVLVGLSPPPDAREQTERCARLISSGVEVGNREAATRWLPTCGLPAAEAESILQEQWERRWGAEGPPRMVQGVRER